MQAKCMRGYLSHDMCQTRNATLNITNHYGVKSDWPEMWNSVIFRCLWPLILKMTDLVGVIGWRQCQHTNREPTCHNHYSPRILTALFCFFYFHSAWIRRELLCQMWYEVICLAWQDTKRCISIVAKNPPWRLWDITGARILKIVARTRAVWTITKKRRRALPPFRLLLITGEATWYSARTICFRRDLILVHPKFPFYIGPHSAIRR